MILISCLEGRAQLAVTKNETLRQKRCAKEGWKLYRVTSCTSCNERQVRVPTRLQKHKRGFEHVDLIKLRTRKEWLH